MSRPSIDFLAFDKSGKHQPLKERFERLCAMPITLMNNEEVAWILGVSEDTCARWAKKYYKMGFAELRESKKADLKYRLFNAQVIKALDGHPTLLIWLGKNLLGQSDKIEQSENPTQSTTRKEQVDALISEMRSMMQDTECSQSATSLPFAPSGLHS